VSIRRENPRAANALYALGVVVALLLFLVWFGMGDRVYRGSKLLTDRAAPSGALFRGSGTRGQESR
jgi:hypothetical protein